MKRIILSLLALAALAVAQPAPDDEPDGQYETGRAVARISVLNGDVSVRRGDSGDVIAAVLNAPVMAGDAILTGSSSRGEVQLDYANMLRFAPNSEVRFAGLDVKNFQIQLASGTVTLRVLRPSEAQVEVDTPSVAVRPTRQGIYRITVREDGSSEVSVRSGEVEIGSPRGTERLGPGRTMNARGPATDPEFQVIAAVPLDNWDRWNEDRDRYLESSRSYEHVSRDIYGAEDLDQNGRWVNDPEYGSVWTPNVAPGWAPYRDGRWVWEDWYGWTWVSSDPWGWAPYHYGRWFQGSAGWCWYPGGFYGRHYWAPAYVGFFGWGGGGFGGGFGFGNVGWVPLAPFERFHPWWGRGFYGGFRNGSFGNHTTIVNNVNIVNTYRNAGVPGGITGVNAGQFGRGGRFNAVDRGQVQQAGVVRGVLPVSPERSSLRMSDRSAGNFSQSRIQNFAGRSQPARTDRVPFEQQQRGMQQLSRSNVTTGRNAGTDPGNFSRGATPNTGGWQRATEQTGGVGTSGGSPNNTSHGWGRFGEPMHGAEGQATQPQSFAGRPADRGQSGRPATGFQSFENTRPGGAVDRGFSRGDRGFGDNGQAVRISPPMVRERAPNFQSPSYQAPRNYGNAGGGGGDRGGMRSAPSFGGGGGGMRSAPSGGGGQSRGGGGGDRGGGGGNRGNSGGGGHGGRR